MLNNCLLLYSKTIFKSNATTEKYCKNNEGKISLMRIDTVDLFMQVLRLLLLINTKEFSLVIM